MISSVSHHGVALGIAPNCGCCGCSHARSEKLITKTVLLFPSLCREMSCCWKTRGITNLEGRWGWTGLVVKVINITEGKKQNFRLDQEVKTRASWDRGRSCLNRESRWCSRQCANGNGSRDPSGQRLLLSSFSSCEQTFPSWKEMEYVTVSKAFLHAYKHSFVAWGFVFYSFYACDLRCLFSQRQMYSQQVRLEESDQVSPSFFSSMNSLLSSGSVSILWSTHLSFSLCRIWYEEIFCITKVA